MEGEGEEAEPPTSFAYPGADEVTHAQQLQQTMPQPQASLFTQFMQSDLTAQTQPQRIVVQDMDQQVNTQQLSMQQPIAPTVPVVQQPQAQTVATHLQLDQVIRQIPDASAQRTIYTTLIPLLCSLFEPEL